MVEQQLEFHPQIQQGQQGQKQGHQGGSPAAGRVDHRVRGDGIGWGAQGKGIRSGVHRRIIRGRRVGAMPMLDQLPTAMPTARATENQNKVLPPKNIKASRGNNVVREV